MTAPLLMLRCTQLGLHFDDLEHVDLGTVYDMFTEKSNDDWDGWEEVATQEDIDKF